MIYKDRLKKLREENKLTQDDIANILRVDRTAYSQFEREYTVIPTKHLNTLCEFYNVSLDYIFKFSNIPNYKNSIKEINTQLSGQRLKDFRKENKITQAKLAQYLNTVQSVIAKIEKSNNLIALPFLYDICKKYNLSADYLLGKIDSPKYLK